MNIKTNSQLQYQINRCKQVKIGIASPEKIKSWSYGEVTKSETINYRTLKPEKRGLFCPQIFGPKVDFCCACEKYNKSKYRGIVCEKCGVEVTVSKVRRERMGHIALNYPVAHPWYLKYGVVSNLLGISLRKLESVINFELDLITNASNLKDFKGSIVLEDEAAKVKVLYKYGDQVEIQSGAGAIQTLLKNLNLKDFVESVKNQLQECKSEFKSKQLSKALSDARNLHRNSFDPSWLILDVLPVLPCDLRPVMQLQGGRFASSDTNELYKSIINRNNRLKRLMMLQAPEVIVNNEKRMLQDAVNNLFEDSPHYQNKSVIKSLSSQIKGKFGRFRLNLLGKRVDYSGRSVISAGPELNLDECGIPVEMCIELFKPMIYNRLYNMDNLSTMGKAKYLIEERDPIVYKIVNDIAKNVYVILNRAPTLHKFGMMAFKPKVISGKAIKLHPLTCSPFNADFDGDTMAIHLPLSTAAQQEAKNLMASSKCILHPSNGDYVMSPSQDMVLGLYFASLQNSTMHERLYGSEHDVRRYYKKGVAKLHDQVKVIINGSIVKTSVGRLLIKDILVHPELKFELINKLVTKNVCLELLDACMSLGGHTLVAETLNKIEQVSFSLASLSGTSIGLSDFVQVNEYKKQLISDGFNKSQELIEQRDLKLTSEQEFHAKTISLWNNVNNKLTAHIQENIIETEDLDPALMNAMKLILISGSRGSMSQIKQILGMRGLMSKTNGDTIEYPVVSNFIEGINPIEYFISTHGARKGLADKALSTADTGYLTRKITVACDDVIVEEEDCGATEGLIMESLNVATSSLTLEQRIVGRALVNDFVYGDLMIKGGQILNQEQAAQISKLTNKVEIRSPVYCKTRCNRICKVCYGMDLGSGEPVKIGCAVGIIAAQCVGEPATQLTLRIFHTGGVYAGSANEQLGEAFADHAGVVKHHNIKCVVNLLGEKINLNHEAKISLYNSELKNEQIIEVPYGSVVLADDEQNVPVNEKLVLLRNQNCAFSEYSGDISFSFEESSVQFNPFLNVYTAIHTHELQAPKVTIKQGKKVLHECTIPSGYQFVAREVISKGDIIYYNKGDFHSLRKDILGGLSRLINILEVRTNYNYAITNKAAGVITNLQHTVEDIKIEIQCDQSNKIHSYVVPNYLATCNFFVGQKIKLGEPLTSQDVNFNSLLKYQDHKQVYKQLVNRINSIMMLHNVSINDKHYEVIVRKMVSKVIVTSTNNLDFSCAELYDFYKVQHANNLLPDDKQITYKRVITSIVKLGTECESFLSAASFQDTTKILTKASVEGRIDKLTGLKESLVSGNPIPCGTGFRKLS